jgi:two-component sensor histidine kinase
VKTWQSAPIHPVVEGALAPHLDGPDRVAIRGENIELTARQALSMSLTVHELATNAAKYGAMSIPAGKVDISWQTDPASGQWLFIWEESDGPPVVAPARSGFGTRLITRVLAADFEGQVDLQYRPEGLRCSLRAPLSSIAQKNPGYAAEQADA